MFISNTTFSLQKKRENFALNVKRIDRETLLSNNRKKMLQQNNNDFEVDKTLHLLNEAIKVYNKKDIKSSFKQINDYNNFNEEQEIRLVQMIQTLLKHKVEDENSSLHNECLNILVKLSLLNNSSQELFNTLTILCQLMEMYNNHINQALSYQILDKILAFIGNISCNNGFISAFTSKLIDILQYQIIFGQKRLLFQAIWALNNILYAIHNETALLNQILRRIGQSDMPHYLVQYAKKNEIKLDQNQLIQIYWLYAELSQIIPYDFAQLQVKEADCLELQLIKLFIYSNLTGQQIVPINCNINQLLNLFPVSPILIQRQLLVIIANLVLQTEIELETLKNLINFAFPICPVKIAFISRQIPCSYCITVK
ncbi:unnamed protein product (macronuclear) [Paramecium tetraurelia]|uniref:IBB domain-containing protein n=1 Tax=Paramecium tetraurelia TaxID=5888 RepID=A0BWX0_PARTE|nr:uncharacterized protein GSPATT00032889001 [Paramecium tetraurelia]CAK63037.1 unnamed protein product [Paramecium tetraurelia]|eukprot:XP_001430435.1 hypothetical protein (macronuclear) [Paramecium tetraurelia strain d4-2]